MTFPSDPVVIELRGSGARGPAGSQFLEGAGAPSSGSGGNGDFYFDSTARAIYGPKIAGAWGGATSLVGATGPTGDVTPAATAAAISAALAAATVGVYAIGAATNVPRGAIAFVLTPGTGGTDATNVAATFSSGNFIGNPVVLFDIVSGAVTNVRIISPGLYIGSSPSAPTVALPGAGGAAALTLTNGFLVGNGQGYWVQSSDTLSLLRYKNVAGTATADTSIQSIPTTPALNAALASLVATVPLPRNNDKLANLTGAFATSATSNADNTLSLNNTSKNCSMQHLAPALLTAQAAGTTVTFLFEKLSGVDLSGAPSFLERDGITTLHTHAMLPFGDGSWRLPLVLDVDTDNIQFSFASTGVTKMRFPVYATGVPARPITDPLLLAAQGMASAETDTIAPIPFQPRYGLTGGTTYTPATGVLSIPNGGGSTFDLYCPLAIADTDPLTVTFDCDEPLHNVINGLSINYQSGHSGGTVPQPQLERVGPKSYRVIYQTLMAGGWTFDGPRIAFSNASGITVNLFNFQVWPGDTLPPTYKVPAIVKAYADDAAHRAISDFSARRRVHIWGDSTSFNSTAPRPDNWPAFLQSKAGDAVEVINHAFGGNVANVGGAQAAALHPAITVTGNAIPADFTPVSVSAYDIAPIMALMGANLYLDHIWIVCGRKVIVSSATYDGSQFPTALKLTALEQEDAPTPVPAGSKMSCVQGLQATADFHIIDGWFNSAAQTLAGMQPFIDRFGIENCMLMPAINALSYGGGPNTYTAAMTAKWPGRVFDQNGGLTSTEIAYLLSVYSYTQTSQDIIDTGNNLLATGTRLTGDNIHLNRMGGDIVAGRVFSAPQFQQMLGAKPVWDGVTGEMRAFSYQPSTRWLQCNGASFSGTTYPDLAAVLGGTTLPTVTVPGTPGPLKNYVYAGAAG